MRCIAIVQVIAAIAAVGFFALTRFVPGLIVAIGYVVVTVGAMRGFRACWALCPLFPVSALALYAPWVAYNFYLYFNDDPVYLDSPGTILAVATPAVLLLVPAVVVLALLVGSWRSYVRVFRSTAA